jgi:quercetin dioxygenase-like cupin family protein
MMIEVFGPTLELLTDPNEAGAVYSVLKGTIPPGVSVPLHSHADPESFYVLSGTVEAYSERGGGFEWLEVNAGEFVDVAGDAKHAWRNIGTVPVIQLLVTTPRLAQFLLEVGRPFTPGSPLPPPTPEELRHFVETATRYGYWMATPEENAAVGIDF